MPRQKGTEKTGGRVKGTPNHLPAALRNEIMAAFFADDPEKGIPNGEEWLMELKRDFKPVFAGLLAKILPKEVAVEVTETTKTFTLNMVGLKPKSPQANVLPALAKIGVDATEIVEGEVSSID